MDEPKWQPVDCQAAIRLLRPEPPGIEVFDVDAVPETLRRQLLSAADLARRLADVCPDPGEHKDGNSTTAIVP